MAEPTEKAAHHFRVMVCVDQSKNAEVAMQYYLDNIHKPDNEILIVYVVQLYMPWPQMYAVGTGRAAVGMGPSPGILREYMDAEKEKKEKLEKKYEAKCKDTKHQILTLFESGDGVGATLVEAIKKHNVNMVVLGSRGLGAIRRTFVGSVSDYVLHHSHIPTVVCPKSE